MDHKKDDSVKAGLEIETEKVVHPGVENDLDELVHELPDELPHESKEEDMDELVHEQPEIQQIDETKEIDVDDLMHEQQDEIEHN